MPPRRSEPAAAPPAGAGFWPLWLGLVIVVAYAGSLRAPYLFDDAGAVVDNVSIRRWATTFTPPTDGSTTTGRPVTNLSFALSHRLGNGAAWGHHAVNLAIHVAAALVLFGLARRTLSGPVLGPTHGRAAAPLAFAGALLWAAHPLQTESVTCIAQRTESLCGLFYLLTLYAFVRGATVPQGGRWLAGACLACLLGMGTKEVMVTAPLMVLLYDRTFVAGSFAAAWQARRGCYLALAATWLWLLYLVLASGGGRGTAAGLGLGVSPWHYLLKQAEALVLYMKLSVWPHPLVLDYGSAVARSLSEVWWQGLVVLGLLAGTGWALVRRPMLGLAGAWFFLILAPSSSVVPLVTQTMAEHRMYLPLAALVGLALAALHRALGDRAWLAGSVLALVLAGLTAARNHDYRQVISIWADSVAKYPDSARARNNLGVELHRAGRAAEALEHLERAIALKPDYVPAYYACGRVLLDLGRTEEAITRLRRAVELGPAHADAQLTLGNALVQAGRLAESLAPYAASIELKPAADAHYNLAVALGDLGRSAEAEQHLRRAVELEPRLAVARGRLGLVLAQGGRLDEAAEQFLAVIALEADNADAHANLGNVRLLQGRVREAVTEYEAALRLRPGDARTEENLRLARESLRP